MKRTVYLFDDFGDDFGAGHGLLNLTPPLVDQVRRREHECAAIAFRVEDRGGCDADRGLAASHLAVDDRGTFTAFDQELAELTDALTNVKTLSGLLPICSSCKKIRDDRGYWNQIETYIKTHSEADFTHGICPD